MAISSVTNNSKENQRFQMYFRDFKDQKVQGQKLLRHKNVNNQIKMNKKK